MTLKVLVLEGLTDRALATLRAEGWQVDERPALPPAGLAAIVAPYHALTVRSGSRITEEVLAAAPNLRVIGRPGAGVDNVDVEAAAGRGIVVMNSPAGNVVPAAELTLGLLLALARRIPQADASMKAGRWDRGAFVGIELSGRSMGVVGLGRIGREVAARCRAFGMEVSAHDPFVAPAEAEGVPLLALEALLEQSDFLSLHAALTPGSRHLLGRDALARVKRGIFIVNAARGDLVDEEALLEALDSGRVAGAAIDVHAREPPVDWRLAQHPRVVATPHIGAATREARERVAADLAVRMRDFLKGGVTS